MKYGPLKSKKQKMKKDTLKSMKHDVPEKNKFYSGFEKGVDDSFDLFASVVDLYKRYKGDVKLLMNEQRKVWSEWVNYYDSQSDIDVSTYLDRYNNWLFDYAFSDIDGKKSDDFFSL